MIILEPLFHRGTSCIAIKGKYHSSVLWQIRKLSALRYSSTHRCYYTEYREDILETLRLELRILGAEFEDRCVKREFEESGKSPQFRQRRQTPQGPRDCISLPPAYSDHLIKCRYSAATRHNYEAQFKAFLSYISPKTADHFCEEDIDRYLLYLVRERKVSHSTQNQAINSSRSVSRMSSLYSV